MEFHPDRDYQLMAARFLPNFCKISAKCLRNLGSIPRSCWFNLSDGSILLN